MRHPTSLSLVILAALLVGCSESESEPLGGHAGGEPTFAEPPTIHPNPVARVPLIAIIECRSTVPCVASLQIDDGQRTWEQPAEDGATTVHRLAALELRPDREHLIRVRLTDPQSGRTATSEPLRFVTPPLPPSFPPLHIGTAEPAKMEPGRTLFAVNLWRNDTSAMDEGYIIALDERGDVVWYCHAGDRIADIQLTSDGHLLYLHGNYRYAYEIDIFGRDIRRWYGSRLVTAPDDRSIPVDVDTMHHVLTELPNGNMLTLATEMLTVEAFPSSEFEPDAPKEPANLISDRIIEFAPETGEVVDELALADLLDPERIGYMSLGPFWNETYHDLVAKNPAGPQETRDWTHANALLYLPDENAVIVSLRHLDCVLKIDWETKLLRWILGDPGGWGEQWEKYLLKPIGSDFTWFYHQHAPQVTPHGTLLLFDNGNYRARPFEEATFAPENHSRVAEFRIDEEAMTVEQVFEYWGTKDERFYSPFYGEADWLPKTANLLVTDGGHVEAADGTPRDTVPADRQWARIFEITREDPPKKVFEVIVDSGFGSHEGWSIYRAERLPNFFEPFRIAPPDPDHAPQIFERTEPVSRHRDVGSDAGEMSAGGVER